MNSTIHCDVWSHCFALMFIFELWTLPVNIPHWHHSKCVKYILAVCLRKRKPASLSAISLRGPVTAPLLSWSSKAWVGEMLLSPEASHLITKQLVYSLLRKNTLERRGEASCHSQGNRGPLPHFWMFTSGQKTISQLFWDQPYTELQPVIWAEEGPWLGERLVKDPAVCSALPALTSNRKWRQWEPFCVTAMHSG